MRSLPFQRFWLSELGIGSYRVEYVKVNHRGVLDTESGRLNNSFVGASMDHEKELIYIFHTRRLHEIDLLHEFICYLHDGVIPHDEIDPICEKLIAARRKGVSPKRLIARYALAASSLERVAAGD